MSWAKGLTGEALEEYKRVLGREAYHDEAKMHGHAGQKTQAKKTLRVLLIQTGGTIDKDYPRKTKGYAFEIADAAIVRVLSGLDLDMSFRTVTACRKDSTEITNADRTKIMMQCMKTKAKHIIITHGTDTMIQTAEFLGNAQKWRKVLKNKVIIITGAMKPEKFKDSDAAFNVGVAVGGLSMCKPGVYVAMHGQIIEHANAGRDLRTGRFIVKRTKRPKSKL